MVRQKYRAPCRFGPPSAASPLETLYFEGKLRKARNEIERRQWTRLPLAIPLFVLSLVRVSENILVRLLMGVAVAMRNVVLVLGAWPIHFVVGW